MKNLIARNEVVYRSYLSNFTEVLMQKKSKTTVYLTLELVGNYILFFAAVIKLPHRAFEGLFKKYAFKIGVNSENFVQTKLSSTNIKPKACEDV